jgi:hypothetical protein
MSRLFPPSALALCLFLLNPAAGATQVVPEAELLLDGFVEPVEQSIFMGMELAVIRDEEKFPIVRLKDKQLFVENKGRIEPVREADEFFWKTTILHSDNWIRIQDLNVIPGYSKMKEEMKQYQDMDSFSEMTDFMSQLSLTAAVGAVQFEGEMSGMSPAMTGVDSFDSSSFVSHAEDMAAAADSFSDMSDERRDAMSAAAQDRTLFDFLRIQLEVTPGQTVEEGYLLVIAKYYGPEASQGDEYEINVKLFECPVLESGKSTQLDFLFGGFPVGPKIGEMTYHFFSGSDEIPTNYSYQRMLLEEDQVFDFLYADYVTREVEEDKQPALFKKVKVDASWNETIIQGLADVPLSLRVLPDGSSEIIELEVEGKSLREKVEAVVRECKFFPAIQSDELVEAEVSLRLRDLLEI